VLNIDESAEETPAEHRSAELTRPLRLSRAAIVSATLVTAAMFAILGLGIGRDTLGIPRRMPPERIELTVQSAGGSGEASFGRQIAMAPNGAGVVFLMDTEEDENAIAYQDLDSQTPVLVPGSKALEPPEKSEQVIRLESQGLRVQQMLSRNQRALAVRAAPGRVSGKPVIRDIESGSETQVLQDEVVEARLAAHHIVYVRPDGSLWAAPFDEKEMKMTSPPKQIGSNVALTGAGIAQFAVSKNGNLAYLPEAPRSLVLVSRTGQLRFATAERRYFSDPHFLPGGRRISVTLPSSNGFESWTVSRDGGNLERAARAPDSLKSDSSIASSNAVGKRFAVISRDGRRLAYVSNETGRDEVYVREWNPLGPPVRVSQNGGIEPVWSPDNKELFYRETPTQYLVAATMRVDTVITVGVRRLFPVHDMVPGFTHAGYDVSPDGKSFVMVRRAAAGSIRVLQNFPELLRR
jgi:hypothetical protein